MSEDDHSAPSFLRRNLRFLPLIIFIALAGVFLLRLNDRTISSDVPSPLVGKPAPNVVLEPLIGLKRDGLQLLGLDDTRFLGKTTLVNVFASWCAPCREEHPYLLKISKNNAISVVGINYKDAAQNALRFLGALGNPYEAVGIDPRGKYSIEWGVYGVPESYIIDKKGIIRYKHIGPINGENIERIRQELKKAEG